MDSCICKNIKVLKDLIVFSKIGYFFNIMNLGMDK